VDLRAAAKEGLAGAREGGATSADAMALEAEETLLEVRRGELETSRRSETRGAGIRAFRDGRTGVAWTTDVSPAGLRRAGREAAALARVAGEDPASGLPDAADRGSPADLPPAEDPSFDAFDPAAGLEIARRAEAAAFAVDPRIGNSDGARFSAARVRTALAASDGFEGFQGRTRFTLSVAVVAEEPGGLLQRDAWHARSLVLADLESPEAIGAEAGARCVRRLGAVKGETRRVPVVLSPEVAASLAAEIAGALSGGALLRDASFLADALGREVASPLFTLVDDPLLPGGLASRPFDGEGVRPRRKALIERGVLRRFLFDAYSLRRVRAERPARAEGGVPGNADRGLAGAAGAGSSNLFVEAGATDPAAILAGVEEGLYVTETMGFGVNPVTGDYSKGAAGLRIRKGRLDHPVQEITIAGNMAEMLRAVDAVGNDLRFRAPCAAPTIRIAEMTVSGA
jgi:PmbA protein